MPEVIIVGAGLAGMTAATRLMEQGFDITLYEQNNFLGGKLGAYRVAGKSDPHEHCYHMYLNWYNNFWKLMGEIGALDKFAASPVIGARLSGDGDGETRRYLVNAGAPATTLTNMMNGIVPPAEYFLWSYSLLDLIGTQSMSGKDTGANLGPEFFPIQKLQHRSFDRKLLPYPGGSFRRAELSFVGAKLSEPDQVRLSEPGSVPVAAHREHQRRHFRAMGEAPESPCKEARAPLQDRKDGTARKASSQRRQGEQVDVRAHAGHPDHRPRRAAAAFQDMGRRRIRRSDPRRTAARARAPRHLGGRCLLAQSRIGPSAALRAHDLARPLFQAQDTGPDQEHYAAAGIRSTR